MFLAAAQPFLRTEATDEMVFVVPREWYDAAVSILEDAFFGKAFQVYSGEDFRLFGIEQAAVPKAIAVCTGGADRAASVRNGVEALSFDNGLVLIHDAARPFVTRAVIDRVLEGTYEAGAAVPVLPLTDTIYEIQPEPVPKGDSSCVPKGDGSCGSRLREPQEPSPFGTQKPSPFGTAMRVLSRERLAAAQTPQGFDLALIRAAQGRALDDKLTATDDGSVVLAAGGELRLVEGDSANRKVTTKEDLQDHGDRVGIGFDAHRFEEGRPLILGGVEVPFDKGLSGHSDADVVTHALMDAILGALSEGDIGKMFPDTDPRYKGISSMILLREVVSLMDGRGYEAVNADITVIAEKPRLSGYSENIEASLAEALSVDPGCVSLKATTTEKLGFTGREEGMAAEAVVLLRTKQKLQRTKQNSK